MRITDHIDLFYPSNDAKRYASERRRKIRESGTRFAEDLQLDIIKKIVSLSGSERFIALAEELSDDIETIQYRLDCLEDFLNNPDLAQSFHRIFSEFSERRSDDEEADEVDSFYDIKDKMDELSGFLGTIEEINKLYKRTGRSIRSKAVRGLFDFFAELPEKEEYKSISESLDELNKTFSKTIRSVKIGVNFVGNMIPDSAGIIEVSYDKIYPKGNILERMVFGDTKGKEKFSGEEHLNSLTHRTPVDIDTALFRELSEYTREYADRIAAALKNYRLSFFSDLSELIRQAETIPVIDQQVIDELRDANEGKKKLLVLINPPFGEATSSDNARKGAGTNASKTGIADSKWGLNGMQEWGKAGNELFTQFITRIAKELPEATIAMFSKMKHIASQTMLDFRNVWKAKYLGGFIVHSKSFDGLRGDFPIGFLIWKTGKTHYIFPEEISCEVLDKNTNPIGEKKFYNAPTEKYLTNWIVRPKSNKQDVIPLKNAIDPATATKDLRGTKWSNSALAYFWCNSNDLQQAEARTALFSSGFNGGHGIYVNEMNLWQVAVVFSVRRLYAHDWKKDCDQFLQPNCELPEDFKNDCLVWMLFNGSNLTASANDLEWNGKKWNIVNHFIPFTEEEVGASDRFESDFMVQYMQGKTFSTEAQDVLDEGRKIWAAYFKQTFNHKIREELKLNRPDVGWYQIRQALKAQNESGNSVPVSFATFEAAYKALSEKLRPQVYQYGFLK